MVRVYIPLVDFFEFSAEYCIVIPVFSAVLIYDIRLLTLSD
nr:MAG TPA: hypothetical protein [Caudoviricetes sp.]